MQGEGMGSPTTAALLQSWQARSHPPPRPGRSAGRQSCPSLGAGTSLIHALARHDPSAGAEGNEEEVSKRNENQSGNPKQSPSQLA